MKKNKRDQLVENLAKLLFAKYGRTHNVGPGSLRLVARVAVLEGWVTQESLPSFDVTQKNVWKEKEGEYEESTALSPETLKALYGE